MIRLYLEAFTRRGVGVWGVIRLLCEWMKVRNVLVVLNGSIYLDGVVERLLVDV